MSLFLIIAVIFTSTTVFAADGDGFLVIMDVVIARPFGLAALVIGSAFFVVALPFAAMSSSTHKTADKLVGEPFRFTFIRPPGNFSQSYMVNRDDKLQQQETNNAGEEEKRPQDQENSE